MENDVDLMATMYPSDMRPPTPRSDTETLKDFIEAVKKLAFEMPPVNNYTSRFVMLCILAENAMHDKAEEDYKINRAAQRQIDRNGS